MRFTNLPDGTPIPVIGQGTFSLGENMGVAKAEIALLKGLSYGLTLIDTAEDYGNGSAEKIVGQALRQIPRNDVFIVSKVLPRNARWPDMLHACTQSLERLQIGHIDLYLLHWWRNVYPHLDITTTIPLAEIVENFERLKTEGLIKRWGVANFSFTDMRALIAAPGGDGCATNQVPYSIAYRKIEPDLLPWCQEHKIPIMAHSPLGIYFNALRNPTLQQVGDRHDATPAQIALAWLLRHSGVIVIPKADRASHTRENALAVEIKLTQEDYADLERAFPYDPSNNRQGPA